ncbi:hypothetical protein FQZ97_1041330 [compost metagenome]
MREGEHQLDEALGPDVEATAEVTRRHADGRADDGNDRDDDEGDHKRDARSDENARQQVAAELVCSEQMHWRAVDRAEEMALGRDQAEELVGRALDEEAEDLRIVVIGADDGLERNGVKLRALA